MHLHVYKDDEVLSNAVAEWITLRVQQQLIKKEFFSVALSGGETPKKLYQKLAAEPFCNKINWKRLQIFWGDERVVPPDDERGNAKMAFDLLLSKVDIPAGQIHRINTAIEPHESAKAYENLLYQYFDGKENTFDLVLLGLGDDGHTLSLFPGSNILNNTSSWVVADEKKHNQMKRITLMPSVVNRSAAVAFLVSGESKANVLKDVLQHAEREKYPAQLIQPSKGELHWFFDEKAGKYLSGKK